MTTAVNSSSANQESYRTQLASNRSDRSLTSLSNSLKAAEKMASAIGADSTGLQNAIQRVAGNSTANPGESSRVTLSSEALSRQQAERSGRPASVTAGESAVRPERRQFASVDEAIAYGASRASEQASARAIDRVTANNNPANNVEATRGSNPTEAARSTAASNRSERRQFASVDEAIAYGASRASEQATNRNTARSTNEGNSTANAESTRNEASSRTERRQFSSVNEAISYGAQRAVDQYQRQQLALGSAQNGNRN